MQEDNFLNIINSTLEVDIKELGGMDMSPPELIAESILLLLNSLDIKEFDRYGIYDRYDIYMERILGKIHCACEWAGWTERG